MAHEVRPNPTTMEGMIWNANHVLEAALNPNLKGLPKALFERCFGVVLMHSVQAGFIFSACTGSGIVLRKNPDGYGSGWSPPCAIGVGGLGFGIMAGISAKDMVIFIMDEPTMKALTAGHGFKLGANYELTIGPLGRSGESQIDFSREAIGSAFAIGYSKGVFGGINLEGEAIGPREFVNNKFYNTPTSADAILYQRGSVEIPEGKVTMMGEVYEKLNKLQQGTTAKPTAEEVAKKAAAKEVADEEGEAIVSVKEAEIVEAGAEAAKETS